MPAAPPEVATSRFHRCGVAGSAADHIGTPRHTRIRSDVASLRGGPMIRHPYRIPLLAEASRWHPSADHCRAEPVAEHRGKRIEKRHVASLRGRRAGFDIPTGYRCWLKHPDGISADHCRGSSSSALQRTPDGDGSAIPTACLTSRSFHSGTSPIRPP